MLGEKLGEVGCRRSFMYKFGAALVASNEARQRSTDDLNESSEGPEITAGAGARCDNGPMCSSADRRCRDPAQSQAPFEVTFGSPVRPTSPLPELPPGHRLGDNSTIIEVAGSIWVVEFHPLCEAWAENLEPSDQEALLAAVRILRDEGPGLGRPLVDTVKQSRHQKMKELRPGSTGRTEVRVLFTFDKERKAILLVGGDKSGNWTGWYKSNVPIADERFDEHQRAIDRRRAVKIAGAEKKARRTRGSKR